MSFRRKHKKGQEEEQTKKRTRRTQKFQRAIVGASLTDILAKRNMKPEIRKAQRDQAIKYAFFRSTFGPLLTKDKLHSTNKVVAVKIVNRICC